MLRDHIGDLGADVKINCGSSVKTVLQQQLSVCMTHTALAGESCCLKQPSYAVC